MLRPEHLRAICATILRAAMKPEAEPGYEQAHAFNMAGSIMREAGCLPGGPGPVRTEQAGSFECAFDELRELVAAVRNMVLEIEERSLTSVGSDNADLGEPYARLLEKLKPFDGIEV